MTQQAIYAIEAGQVSRPTKLVDIALALNVEPGYLLGTQDETHTHDPNVDVPMSPIPDSSRPDRHTGVTRIPDLEIFAGMGPGGLVEVNVDKNGRPMDPDQVRGYWEMPDYLLRRFGDLKNVYAWEVRGDSMEPTLTGGSVVFVDTSQLSPPPDDIYAINYGDGLMIKRLKLVPRTETVRVISDNKIYGEDVLQRDEVMVWGRVIGWFRWRD